MSWSLPAFEVLAQLLAERTGLAFAPDRRPGVELGIRRALGRAGLDDLDQYVRKVKRDVALFDDLVGELTIGETYFFREPDHFAFLRDTIFPEFRARWGEKHVLRAWSAGCASGEEAYTLAMVFAEEGLADRAHLLATDIAPAALAKARGATYGPWSLRGEGAAAARPYLDPRGGLFVVKEAIRRRVTFEQLNLAVEIYPSIATGTWGLDLIFCRNVLIYFDRATIRAVAQRLFRSLGAGGWLITASSDPPLGDEAPFETVVTERGIFYRKGLVSPALAATVEPHVERRFVAGPAPDAPSPVFDPPPSLRITGGEDREDASVSVSTPELTINGRKFDAAGAREDDLLGQVEDDLLQGRYAEAAERSRSLGKTTEAAALRVRALANLDPTEAERECAAAIEGHPLSGELNYLHAVLLHALGRDDEAVRAARRVLYLDRSQAVAHFLLGVILCRRGDRAGAWRSFRNARDLCASRPDEEVVPFSDGEPAGRLAAAAAAQMARLGQPEGAP